MTVLKRVTVVPGDDAAPEAMAATLAVLDHMRLPIDWTVLAPGQSLSPALADASDTVLFGSSNGATAGLAHLRFGWGTFANVRPVKFLPGAPAAISRPERVDYVIVREALQDVYAGIEGPLSSLVDSGLSLTTHSERRGIAPRFAFADAADGVYGMKIYTVEVVQRVARFAAELAAKRKALGYPGRVTIGGKWNVAPVTDGFFRRVAAETISAFTDITCRECLADDLGRRMVMQPEELDVVLLPNLFGDILSDVGAGTIGGLGFAPSGGYGDERAYFEPVHGSAPDIVGRHVINPTATMLSAAMMLDYLGLAEAAATLERGVRATIEDGRILTPDMGGSASTEAFADAVATRC